MIANIANQINSFALEPKIVEPLSSMKTPNNPKLARVKAATSLPEEISLTAAASCSANTDHMNFTSE